MAKRKKTKTTRLAESYESVVGQYLEGRGYFPQTRKEIMQRLGIPEDHGQIVNQVLKELVRGDVLELKSGKYHTKLPTEELTRGSISVHPRGFGFVKPSNAPDGTPDIFIPKHMMLNAVDGDVVEVYVDWDNIPAKGPDGEVVAIIERGRTHLAGTVTQVFRDGDALVFAPLLGQDRAVEVRESPSTKLKLGDRVVLKVLEWHTEDQENTICDLVRVIGNIDDPSCDVEAAIEEFELRHNFPVQAVTEAKSFGSRVRPKDLEEREDLRDLICVTIDPDTAKDFDDAISLTRDSRGNYQLGVHIADVSHYVQAGSPLDEEACERCNSTYFPGEVVPMLPHELSSNLCSLKPNVNRLAISVLMTLDQHGKVKTYRITRSVIRSRRRFTYREAKEVLEGRKRSPHKKLLQDMVALCGHLRQLRFQRGSLDLAVPDAVVLVDKDGVPTGIDYVEYDVTHQMIEEFMLKANEVIAKDLTDKQQQVAYRIHQEPSDEDLRGFVALAKFFGYKLSQPPTAEELQALFDEAKESSYGEYLATNYIRCMKMAYYSPDNVGHYGLSLEHYCHFTSPIRRYADLVVHRVLFGHDPSRQDMERVTTKCSEQERISARAEGSVRLLKKLRMLREWQQENSFRQYDAVVTGVKPFGVAFEIPSILFEGFLHVREMGHDYFNYDPKRQVLRGEDSGVQYQISENISVMLSDVDLIKREARWELVPEEPPETTRRRPSKRGKRRRR